MAWINIRWCWVVRCHYTNCSDQFNSLQLNEFVGDGGEIEKRRSKLILIWTTSSSQRARGAFYRNRISCIVWTSLRNVRWHLAERETACWLVSLRRRRWESEDTRRNLLFPELIQGCQNISVICWGCEAVGWNDCGTETGKLNVFVMKLQFSLSLSASETLKLLSLK